MSKKNYVDAQDSTISEALKQFKAQLVSDLSKYVKKNYVDTQDDTISEALKHFKAQLVSDLSEYAKKDYVDAQDDLRVLKTGDTIVSNPLITVWWISDMSGRLEAMRLGAMRMGATPCWPQVGSSQRSLRRQCKYFSQRN